MIKVSVIIPTYNRSDLLERALKSVINQTIKNIEILVVDDCSTDNTSKLIKQYQNKDKRIKYLKNKKNEGGGGSVTRNQAIKKAQGKYIAFLDDDDEWLPTKLEKQIPFVNKFSVIGTEKIFEEKKITENNKEKIFSIKKINIEDALSGRLHISPSTLLTKTSYLKKINGFDENLVGSVGWDLNIRLIENFGPGAILSSTLTIMHQKHGYQRVSKTEKYLNGIWKSYYKHRHLMNLRIRRRRIMYIHVEEVLNVTTIRKKIARSFRLLLYIDIFFIWAIGILLRKIKQKVLCIYNKLRKELK